jgi:Transposase IS4
LEVSDPTKDEQNKQNRMLKVQEVYDIFITACKANFYPDCKVSVDEAVKKFKGRCIFKQYIKGKPVRFGIKIFCLCCSVMSYLFNAIFYLGKSDIPAVL